MDALLTLERRVQDLYQSALCPLAERVGFQMPKNWKGVAGSPNVLFLGNHSSGKSSFINYLVGAEIQKSGLAPTDDGFTIITFGESADEFDGQTVVTHRDLAYSELQRLGPAFLSRLRLKTYPHELLRSVTLIDSPGMIDAAGKANTRGYDFAAAVRYFAEQADLILFFFDPDKPGTTGETVSIFTETLTGLEYKLLIILNKVDLFSNIRDFARTYGTLCWNLSKTVRTKDIPHIFNMYVPGRAQAPRPDAAIPLADFDDSRGEVIQEIRRAPTRRSDNLVSNLYQCARRLAVHARMFQGLSREYRKLRWKWWATVAGVAVLTGVAMWLLWGAQDWKAPWLALLSGAVVALVVVFAGRLALRRWKDRAEDADYLDHVFERIFRRELAYQDRADLRALWESVRPQLAVAIDVVGPAKVSPFSLRKPLRRVDKMIEDEVLPLRRDVAEFHRQRSIQESPQPEDARS